MVTYRVRYINISSQEEKNNLLGISMEGISIQVQKKNEEVLVINLSRPEAMVRYNSNIKNKTSVSTIGTPGGVVWATLGKHIVE